MPVHKASFIGTRIQVQGRNRQIYPIYREYLTCDLFGPLLRTKGGARYAAFYIDLRSRYVFVKLLRDKIDHYTAFLEVLSELRGRSGHQLRFFKTDGDGIFTGNEAKAIYQDNSIVHTRSAPGDSASNDVAERTIRTFAELTCTNLIHAGAPLLLMGGGDDTCRSCVEHDCRDGYR